MTLHHPNRVVWNVNLNNRPFKDPSLVELYKKHSFVAESLSSVFANDIKISEAGLRSTTSVSSVESRCLEAQPPLPTLKERSTISGIKDLYELSQLLAEDDEMAMKAERKKKRSDKKINDEGRRNEKTTESFDKPVYKEYKREQQKTQEFFDKPVHKEYKREEQKTLESFDKPYLKEFKRDQQKTLESFDKPVYKEYKREQQKTSESIDKPYHKEYKREHLKTLESFDKPVHMEYKREQQKISKPFDKPVHKEYIREQQKTSESFDKHYKEYKREPRITNEATKESEEQLREEVKEKPSLSTADELTETDEEEESFEDAKSVLSIEYSKESAVTRNESSKAVESGSIESRVASYVSAKSKSSQFQDNAKSIEESIEESSSKNLKAVKSKSKSQSKIRTEANATDEAIDELCKVVKLVAEKIDECHLYSLLLVVGIIIYLIYILFYDVSEFVNAERRYRAKMRAAGIVLRWFYYIMHSLNVPMF